MVNSVERDRAHLQCCRRRIRQKGKNQARNLRKSLNFRHIRFKQRPEIQEDNSILPMPLPNIFSSSSKKRSNSSNKRNVQRSSPGSPSRATPPPKSPSKSFKTPTESAQPRYPDLSRPSATRSNSHRPSLTDTHPLNLAPAEREWRRSFMSTADESVRSSMDVDSETEYTNTNGDTNHAQTNHEIIPPPPPHKNPSPPPKPSIDPEACKALGNKYFKAKDYTRAVAEYTKGTLATTQAGCETC